MPSNLANIQFKYVRFLDMLKQKHNEGSEDELLSIRKAGIVDICELCFPSKYKVLMKWLKKVQSLFGKPQRNDELNLECLSLP